MKSVPGEARRKMCLGGEIREQLAASAFTGCFNDWLTEAYCECHKII